MNECKQAQSKQGGKQCPPDKRGEDEHLTLSNTDGLLLVC